MMVTLFVSRIIYLLRILSKSVCEKARVADCCPFKRHFVLSSGSNGSRERGDHKLPCASYEVSCIMLYSAAAAMTVSTTSHFANETRSRQGLRDFTASSGCNDGHTSDMH